MPIEFLVSVAKEGDEPRFEKTRRDVVCVCGVFPRQEQLDKIVNAYPELLRPQKQSPSGRDKEVAGAERPANPDRLLEVLDFQIERQEWPADLVAGRNYQQSWHEIDKQDSINLLSSAIDQFVLFRFLDFDTKKNRRYRYRVKLVYRNPEFAEIRNPGLPWEKGHAHPIQCLQSPWSEPSSVALVR